MIHYSLAQHLLRVWSRHWPLQLASVTVMTLVLVLVNFLFLAYSGFNQTVTNLSRGLEMVVYLNENATDQELESLKSTLNSSGDFTTVSYTDKTSATQKFLSALGDDSLELLKDPKWSSPVPASLELKLLESIPLNDRVSKLESWASRLKSIQFVEDIFYGQGWVENFSSFLSKSRIVMLAFWILSLSVGLLIVSNCIRLSFLQRREEIEVLELVGATARFIRMPFVLEGVVLGVVASLVSLAVSSVLHVGLLAWLNQSWGLWLDVAQIPALQFWQVVANMGAGILFGFLGAWSCVRRLNTGWSAAVG